LTDTSELIDKIYSFALDPLKLEEFSQWWLHNLDDICHAVAEMQIHLLQAAELIDRLHIADNQNNHSLSSAAYIAFQVNAEGVAHHLNDAAKQMFQRDDLFLKADIDQLLSNAANLAKKTDKQFLATALNNPENETAVLFHVSNFSRFTLESGSALVVSTSVYWSAELANTLQDQFDLTKTELHIIQDLMNGHSARDVALRRSRSLETVRTQIRKILKKVHVDSQLGLVRLILGLVVTTLPPDIGLSESSERDIQIFLTATNETLLYVDVGKKELPVLLFIRDYDRCQELPDELFDLLLRKGFRIVAVDTVEAETALNHWSIVNSLGNLADHLELDHFTCLSGAEALPLGHALAELKSGCDGILLLSRYPAISGQIPDDPAVQFRQLLLTTAEKVPAALPFLLRAQRTFRHRMGQAEVIRQLYTLHQDKALLAAPKVLERIADVLLQELPEQALLNEILRGGESVRDHRAEDKVPVLLVTEGDGHLGHYAYPRLVASNIQRCVSELKK